ncbi:glycoside hydrolase family 2 TIM barrel-domain containing protein [Rathayibacter sp. Leaf296]|uniref:glycoside hydrolase family 2 TIM barrel-domain containing protein n=1 Tax=Rathayibacter sp. Leaf296 TaxID=1736327 RepID=UPI0007034DCE|nr:glycoside hydrolase family 2 TIM barrel-domain containing protein [Rathayibacter sp. Leaf296]KQQ09674.1 glycoside hydrolase [Rathayibacter sp. Leaf296]
MVQTSFTSGWRVQPKSSIFGQLFAAAQEPPTVTLPHDAMLGLTRSPDAVGGSGNGYFPGAAVQYTKLFDAPSWWSDRRVSVEFDGVYRDAMVFVNGVFAGQRPHGYIPFRIALDPFLRYGEQNEIRVEARSHQDSRWYSGLGIHRGVMLSVTALQHVRAGGTRITTTDVDARRAVVEIELTLENEEILTRTLRVRTEILDAEGTLVASDSAPITLRPHSSGVLRHRLVVAAPHLWSTEDPHLHTCTTTIEVDAFVVDEQRTRFGIRTLQLDPLEGLRINGEVVKLRGACIHHDNGVLGAAAIPRADERRIEILKSAGFNAVRSSHNPLSTAMLDACDRLGVLVLDEAFDMWAESKNNFDYSLAFPEWWERDIEAMVVRGFNHPSVIAYSIGNEVLDAGKPLGAGIGRALAEKVRSLDPTRFVTNSISSFVATISDLLPVFLAEADVVRSQGNVNDLMAELHHLMDRFGLSDSVTDATEESHAVVDIVGHNYGDDRYLGDRERFPNRVVLGTETLSHRIDLLWDLVMSNPHVIGDFTWTGWDYLGEAGLGQTQYVPAGEEPAGPAYPWLLAWCGDIDITGYRRPASYYREIVFGLRAEPYLAVHRPAPPHERVTTLNWAWSDTVGSWTFDVEAGTPMTVDVYSAAPEVELLLNGRSLGIRGAGAESRFTATFDVPYETGDLEAVARDGSVVTRTLLRSARSVAGISAEVDRAVVRADDSDLAYVEIELVDENGVLSTADDRVVTVAVAGAGRLQGLGSARPATTESYLADSVTTFEGRAIAVVRPTGAGVVRVTVSADGFSTVTLTVDARASAESP